MVQIDLKLVIGQFLDAMNRVRESWAKFSEDSKKAATEAAKAFDQTTKKATEAGDAAKKTAATAGESAIVLSRMYGVMGDSMKGTDESKTSKFYQSLVNIAAAFRNIWDAVKSGNFSKIADIIKNSAEIKSASDAFGVFSNAIKTGSVASEEMAGLMQSLFAAVAAIGPEMLVAASEIAVFVAAGAGLYAVSSIVKRMTQDMAELSARSREVGMSAAGLYTIEKAFQAIGANSLDASTGIERFLTKLSEARFGSGETAAALRRLSIASGMDLKPMTLLQKGTAEAFYDVVNALRSVGNEAQRVEIASKLFTGKTGPEIKALIDTGSLDSANAKFSAFQQVIEKFGGSFTAVNSEATMALSAVTDGIKLVISSIASLTFGFFAAFKQFKGTEYIANGFALIADSIADVSAAFDILAGAIGFVAAAFAKIFELVAAIFNVVSFVVKAITNLFITLVGVIVAALNGITFGLLGKVAGLSQSSVEGVKEKWAKGKESAAGVSGFMPVEAFKPMQVAIASSLTKVGGGGESFGTGGYDPMYELARQQLDTQKQIVTELQRKNETQNTGIITTAQSSAVFF